MNFFVSTIPGLEPILAQEAKALGLNGIEALPGGVAFQGSDTDMHRANLWLRTASHVLMRLTEFRAMHLAQLDKRFRRIDWAQYLPKGCAVKIEALCRRSRIYHEKAAAQRLFTVLSEQLGATKAEENASDIQRLMLRIEDDLCTISLDSSGAPLHRRNLKPNTVKAPLRETLAAGCLAMMGFDGTQPVVDPMCGSGTFPLVAAEIAAGLAPGRNRRFAFEAWPGVDAKALARVRADMKPSPPSEPRFWGFDRDQGAIRSAGANAEHAGLADWISFDVAPISALQPPQTSPGLVMVNPPYGARIGNKKLLYGLYASLGTVMRERFSGWRLGMVTSAPDLAKATGIDWADISPPLPHGSLKIKLYQSAVMG